MQNKPSAAPAGPATVADEDVEAWLQPIPESQRTRKVSGQFWIWAGANLAPINWVLGALGIHLGLGFADTVTVLVLGNLIGMLLFGCFVLLGQKTGATGMVLARAAFGRRGNYLPAAIQALLVIGWCAVNTWIILDLVMALFGTLGWVDPTAHNYGWKIGVATGIMAAQVAIAWFGYKAIAAFEKWTVPPTILILAIMSAVAWFGMKIDWAYAGPAGEILQGSERIAAMSAVMTAIGIGWGITWFTYAADYSRFVSTEVPKRKVYLASVLGQFIPVVWLGILGASLATNSGEIDPGKLIVQNFGVLALPVLLMVLHGPIATNILNIYTFSVATQALDITISRRKLNLFVGVFSLIAVVFFIFQEDFAAVLDAWLIGLVAWVAAWGGVMLVHYFWIEKRWPGDVGRLFDDVGTRRLPGVNWAGVVSLLVGIFSTWLFMYGLVPAMQGPVAVALGGWDLSWLAGGLSSAVTYAVLGPRVHRRYVVNGGGPERDSAAVPESALPETAGTAGPGFDGPGGSRPSVNRPRTIKPEFYRGTAMEIPAFADSAHPISWPGGYRAAASFTFDVDAESCTIAHDPGSTRRMSLMSHQSYGPKVAVPRLLQILQRQDIQATFFIPGFTAESYPDVVRRIVDGGHEIAHHGYLHEPMQGIDAAREARYLDRGLEALAKVAGVRPTGYRAPWWELNWHSPALLADRGFLYDSSLLDGDAPYRFSVADGDPRDLVEIPVDWALDDWEQYAFYPGVTGSGVIESPAKVLEMWTLEAEAHYAAGSCFVLTNHPFISGRPSKAVALEQLISRVTAMEGMWVTTLEKIAEHTRDTVTEVHTHARIDVPGFPDAGARFTPAQIRQPELAASQTLL